MRQSLALLKSLYQETVGGPSANGRQARLLAWSRTIFQNTAKAIETHPEMTLSEYVPLIAARWDTIGLVFALLGTATYQINQNDPVLKREGMPGKDKHGLRKIAMAASDMCIQFSHKLGAMTDPLFWATLQRTVFLNEMHGSAGKRCCRPPLSGLAKKPRLQIMAGSGRSSQSGICSWPPSGQGRRASPILPV
jgi:chromatin structure-remodeling complex subunit RSC3/30